MDEYQLQVPDSLMRWKKFETPLTDKKTIENILHDVKEAKGNEKKGKDFLSVEDIASKNGVSVDDVIGTTEAQKQASGLVVEGFMLAANTYVFETGAIGRCYSRAGVLMVEAIEEAYKQLNCPVHITGEYLAGKNWANCH